ncbi:hypothetical protein [Corynebacterium cystitidis]|uniref:5-bromo-4-chloroindolyl phosphate hydrolysis protein n=1 Tax=Corynebacterium cystitidis DSM 20524 TaxID=1121357 RepID=A0A1H9V9T6_9CORY|nr:hypothetical protein [Corynebacterium cystitidis]WJY82340.1 hypothetical protein CCYS_07060 [Corynebacterium cystitidis DSM 20524]SES18445.1 hypothetical protein SAMN05661109_02129 [Corynebacterium cystitidis DSM 20524]SNV76364.1 putative secreted protein [Corynebacterium cystitidis]
MARKNVVGLIAAALVLVLHAIFGLGAFWMLAVAAAWGAGYVLTPPRSPKALKAAPPKSVSLDLETSMRTALGVLATTRPPQIVTDKARELDQNVRFVLAEWDDLEAYPEHQQSMWNIVKIYFPQVVDTYRDAPDPNLDAAVRWFLDSLNTLVGAVANIKKAILDNNVRELDSHARTLRSKFGNLPGLNDTPPEISG